MSALRKVALTLADVDEGVACEGTSMERRTVKVSKKAFLFLGTNDAMFKLDASAAQATKLGYRVGANGWIKVTFDAASCPSLAVLEKWIAESYAVIAAGAVKKTKKKQTTPKKKAPAKKQSKARAT